jgi:formyl-CoA transferase
MAVLNEINVPCGPVLSTMDLANDEHVAHREMYVELDHPERGKWYNLGCPIKLSDSPVQVECSPLLGEHTDVILSEVLGYDSGEIEGLKQEGAFTR